MRLITLAAAVLAVIAVTVVLATNVLRPPPAATRLAGVSVAVAGYTIEDLGERRHRLRLSVTVSSARDVGECLGFTLDEPFAGRRLATAAGTCPQPRSGSRIVPLVFDGLSDDDLAFPSHTLVWGIPGGRCGPLLELFGVCVVEQAGTAPLELPARSALPSIGPLGSFPFGPLFSFPPP